MARERFNYQDAGLVNFDRATFPHNIGSVGIFEGSIGFEDYLPHVEERLNLVPRYRQRMIRPPFDLSTPVWHDDPNFVARDHVRLVRMPGPGDDRQLRHLASEFFAEPLDRERPLWEILLVQGLEGDRTAQIMKAHHCLVDGVGGVQLLVALLDIAPNAVRPAPAQPDLPQRLPGPAERFIDGIFDSVLDQFDATERFTLTALDPASAVRWIGSVGRALWAAHPYLVRTAPDTPWNAILTGPRHLAWQNLPLADARAICGELGGKVNDVIVTVLAGALRRYFLLHGWDTEEVVLRVAIPVNERGDDEAEALGNHVSIMLAGLPLDVADPRERFVQVTQELRALKQADQAGGFEKLLRVLGRLPAPVQASLGRHLSVPNIVSNLICTNVRGPEEPLYCMGHKMVAHYPWVLATWRMGLSVAVMSYMGNLSFSFTGDAGVLGDIERIAGFLADDFRELHGSIATGGRARKSARVKKAHDEVPPAAVTRQRGKRAADAEVSRLVETPVVEGGTRGTGAVRNDTQCNFSPRRAGHRCLLRNRRGVRSAAGASRT